MWVGRSLARSFYRLQEEFRWHEFTATDAARAMPEPLPNLRLVLSRLARAGWVVRVGRGSYVAMDARWGLERSGPDPLFAFRSEAFFRSLVHATAGVLQLYGARLKALTLFGSAARRDHSTDSDLDLLVVADPLPEALGDRLAELEPLRGEWRRPASRNEGQDSGRYVPQFVPLSPAELAAEPPILLDLTQDAAVLFDPARLLQGALDGLSRKLAARHARRIAPADGPPFWQLSPGARLGEVREL